MGDARVEAAVTNWAPRFTSQGVDYNDFVTVTGAVETWADWNAAWVANGDRHAALAREAAGGGHWLTAGEAWVRAALSYHFAKFVWLEDLATHQAAADQAVAALLRAHAYLDPRAERLEMTFDGRWIGGLEPGGSG